jgi:hypothetical protein
MTSAINPNDIDGAYPVAGQDNDSQGFRDNFTNTATNFQFAADEITDLQNNAVLKDALTGTTLNNNMNGSLLYNFQAQQVSETLNNLGSLVTGSQTLNWTLGSYKTITSTNGSISLGFSNWPASGVAASMVLQITISSVAHTLTFTGAVSVNNAGIQGLNTSTNTITFAAVGTYTFQFSTVDGGTTITVSEVNKRIQPFNNTSEDLVSATAANLALTTSYFSTAAAETATLAAGVAGQIKTFAMYADSGDMVITVTNAGWKSSGTGTITFDAIGDACTLQYINSKWFAIGNNGAVFA